MGKIGLLTISSNTNYGSWSQTYALYRVIKNLGYDIEIIDYHYAEGEADRLNLRGLIDALKHWDGSSEDIKATCERWRIQRGFAKETKEYCTLSKRKYNCSNISETNDIYDSFLIGSDLVWDHRYGGITCNFFLDFVKKGKRKLAYSASSGYTELNFGEVEKLEFRKYLSEFNFIAVREANLKKLLEGIYSKPIPVVCDPTMLLSNSDWKRFVRSNEEKKPYILLYIVDSVKMFNIARHYANKHGLRVLYIGDYSPYRCIEIRKPHNVSDWITLIYYAEKVFTSSYHGLLFSIYFRKEFGFGYRKPWIRFSQISEKLNLEKYEVNHVDYDMEERIDWSAIKKAEEEYRMYSMKVLKEIIHETDRKENN